MRSLSSGAIAEDNDKVNCDIAEHVGRKIQLKLDNYVNVFEATTKRKVQVIPLAFMHNTIKVNKKVVCINPTSLFTRLVAIGQREDDVSQYFQCQLTQFRYLKTVT